MTYSFEAVVNRFKEGRARPNSLKIDRLLHHSHIVNIVGPSYRTKDVLEKLEESKKKEYDAT